MKTLREHVRKNFKDADPITTSDHVEKMITSLFQKFADFTQQGRGITCSYLDTFAAFDPEGQFVNDGELSQYDNSPKTDVSKIVYQNRYVRIDEQRGTLQNAMDARDAAYLEMREYAGSEDSLYESLCLKFAKAYCEWKDEIEKLRRMVAE